MAAGNEKSKQRATKGLPRVIIKRRPPAPAVQPSWNATSSEWNRRTDGSKRIISREKKLNKQTKNWIGYVCVHRKKYG